jgi:3D (Asp-Asp-Asp) domain-containing protein
MRILIASLVGFLALPVSAAAPIPAVNPSAPVAVVPTAPVAKSPYTKVNTYPFTAKLTAYNAVPEQTDSTPFTTGSGAFSNPEVVAARSSDLRYTLPYGTVIKVERLAADTASCNFSKVEDQIGYRVIADAMNPRIVNTVDILMDQSRKVPYQGRMINPALAVKCTDVQITIVGRIPVSAIPDTQAELAAMVEGTSAELAVR